MKYLSVTVLNTYIKNIFCAEEMLHDIQLCGEVSGIRVSGGNAFFTLKDENAAIQCNCFGVKNTYVPKDGETVILFGSVDYWQKAGKLSFNALRITPLGEGALALKLEMLKNRLREEGYFDEGHKKPIPKFPARVCVITSSSGAVIRDIVKTCRAKNTCIDICVYDVRVQGENCDKEICAAIRNVDSMGFDTVIIARGGGSAQDLMPFNSEELVKCIYAMKTPVISAVGHETDYSLCDFAADERAATPTAAAHRIAYDIKEMCIYIDSLINLMSQRLNRSLNDFSKGIYNAINTMKLVAGRYIDSANAKLESRRYELISNMNAIVSDRQARCIKASAMLSAVNPARIMEKGYFYINGENGSLLKSIAQVLKEKDIMINGADGSVGASIKG